MMAMEHLGERCLVAVHLELSDPAVAEDKSGHNREENKGTCTEALRSSTANIAVPKCQVRVAVRMAYPELRASLGVATWDQNWE